MPDFLLALPSSTLVPLLLALCFVLAYEFINGFHDTANAVATVIYTNAMRPHSAVIASGIFNFFGVIFGGLGVAYAIMYLLPTDLILNIASGHGLVMIFSLLSAAILWNLGTWYIGLPASSSHTLIGSILGVGMAHALMKGIPISEGINIGKAVSILLSLIVSPTVGFVIAALLLILLKKMSPLSHMHLTPEERQAMDGKTHPPFWARIALIASAMGMSFTHGSNDGQKGIGLLMLVLIGLAPTHFVLDMSQGSYAIGRTHAAALRLEVLYQHNRPLLEKSGFDFFNAQEPLNESQCNQKSTLPSIRTLDEELKHLAHYQDLSSAQRLKTRTTLLCLDKTAKKVEELKELPAADKASLKKLRQDLVMPIEYAPQWAIIAIALALGLGTMVGWKRIVKTVGEKIGQKGMIYSQGMAAQITAGLAIGLASLTGMPVSTTHVLSSAVAGTMVANRSGLQGGTIKNIVLAWVLTLPITVILSGGLYWLSSKLFV